MLALTAAVLSSLASAQIPSKLAPVPSWSAELSAPRSVSGELPLTLTVYNVGGKDLFLAAPRDSRQNCAAAPLVRVLEVGTRRVVYPAPDAEPLLCAQDLDIRTVAAGGSVVYTRTLNLPAGEYMVEGWHTGGGQKVPAQPVRVTVR